MKKTNMAVSSPFDKLLGTWADEQGDTYEVFLDIKEGSCPSTAKTCSVETARWNGMVRCTQGLISLSRAKGTGKDRILWNGGSYTLREPDEARPASIRWDAASNRKRGNGKPFKWTRLVENKIAGSTQKTLSAGHVKTLPQPEEEDRSDSTSDQPDSEVEPEAPKAAQRAENQYQDRTWRPAADSQSKRKGGTSGLTWRPVENKPPAPVEKKKPEASQLRNPPRSTDKTHKEAVAEANSSSARGVASKTKGNSKQKATTTRIWTPVTA